MDTLAVFIGQGNNSTDWDFVISAAKNTKLKFKFQKLKKNVEFENSVD